jgi:hypothetical protein
MRKEYLAAVFIASVLAFTGCGDDGGGDDQPDSTLPNPIHHWLMNGNANDSIGGKNAVVNPGTVPVSGDPGQFASFTEFKYDDELGREVLYVYGKGANDYNNPNEWNACWVQDFNGPVMTELTASLWIKTLETGGIKNVLVFQKQKSPYHDLFNLSIFSGYMGLGNGRYASSGLDEFGPGYEGEEWRHIALTFKDGAATMYVDGEVAGECESVWCEAWWDADGNDTGNGETVEAAVSVPRIDSFWIGGQKPTQHFYGYISDVRLYNKALTEAQAKVLAKR